MQPEKVARMGMVRTFQLTKVMSRLTVLDNMLLGAPVQPGEGMFRRAVPGMWRKQEQVNIEKAEALLERFLLIKKKDDYAGALSGGQLKLLEMARALMSDPKLVMLDEPMAGVNPALKQSAARPHHGVARGRHHSAVRRTRHQHGETHRRLGHRDGGRQDGGQGQPKSVTNDPAVIDAYLGAHANVDLGDYSGAGRPKEAGNQRHRKRGRRAADPRADPHGRPEGEPLLDAVDLVAGYIPGVNILNGASLTLHEGEIVGIIGPNGAGKSTLLNHCSAWCTSTPASCC